MTCVLLSVLGALLLVLFFAFKKVVDAAFSALG